MPTLCITLGEPLPSCCIHCGHKPVQPSRQVLHTRVDWSGSAPGLLLYLVLGLGYGIRQEVGVELPLCEECAEEARDSWTTTRWMGAGIWILSLLSFIPISYIAASLGRAYFVPLLLLPLVVAACASVYVTRRRAHRMIALDQKKGKIRVANPDPRFAKALGRLRRHPCPACGGSGAVGVQHGAFTVSTTCDRCRGSGHRSPQS